MRFRAWRPTCRSELTNYHEKSYVGSNTNVCVLTLWVGWCSRGKGKGGIAAEACWRVEVRKRASSCECGARGRGDLEHATETTSIPAGPETVRSFMFQLNTNPRLQIFRNNASSRESCFAVRAYFIFMSLCVHYFLGSNSKPKRSK